MKRNYGIAFTLKGKRGEDSTKRYTKKGAEEVLAQLKKAQKQGSYKKIKNPRVIRVK